MNGVLLRVSVKERFSLRLSFENKLDGCEQVSTWISHWEKLGQSPTAKESSFSL